MQTSTQRYTWCPHSLFFVFLSVAKNKFAAWGHAIAVRHKLAITQAQALTPYIYTTHWTIHMHLRHTLAHSCLVTIPAFFLFWTKNIPKRWPQNWPNNVKQWLLFLAKNSTTLTSNLKKILVTKIFPTPVSIFSQHSPRMALYLVQQTL